MNNFERVEILTGDGVVIAGDYAGIAGAKNGVLLLHMMPATRKSFTKFQSKLADKGIASLAIDLRGHGESTKQNSGGIEKNLDYHNFSDVQHQQSINDVRAGCIFLQNRGILKLVLAGASIGANLALRALAEDKNFLGAILLSAGYNYRGIETLSLIKELSPKQAVFFAGAGDDGKAAEMAQGLYDVTADGIKKSIKIFPSGGHGTDLFINISGFTEDCVSWFEDIFRQ